MDINYRTLADFRSFHKDSLDRLFVEVLGIMSAEGLIALSREITTIDYISSYVIKMLV
jgi:hypothetical protein